MVPSKNMHYRGASGHGAGKCVSRRWHTRSRARESVSGAHCSGIIPVGAMRNTTMGVTRYRDALPDCACTVDGGSERTRDKIMQEHLANPM